jgi:hypothetical protein
VLRANENAVVTYCGDVNKVAAKKTVVKKVYKTFSKTEEGSRPFRPSKKFIE